jgi:hypothetical protein
MIFLLPLANQLNKLTAQKIIGAETATVMSNLLAGFAFVVFGSRIIFIFASPSFSRGLSEGWAE